VGDERLLVISGLDSVPELDAQRGNSRQDRRDRPMRAQRERRIQERVDGRHDARVVPDEKQQVREQLHVAGTLLHADDTGHLPDDASQELGGEVRPGNHVVDDDGKARAAGQGIEVTHHRVVVRTEQIVDGCDLERRHAEVLDREASLDR